METMKQSTLKLLERKERVCVCGGGGQHEPSCAVAAATIGEGGDGPKTFAGVTKKIMIIQF